MVFTGPSEGDFSNVLALNKAWLDALQHDDVLQDGLATLPESTRERLCRLSVAEIARLADAPFLLFSFYEGDDGYWSNVLGQPCDQHLFGISQSAAAGKLVAGGIGFVWQLARRNPYTLRLLSGATLHWCETIAKLTFMELIDAFYAVGDVPVARFSARPDTWCDLLEAGTGKAACLRKAVHMTALQRLLTEPQANQRCQNSELLRAARRTQVPVRQVADSGKASV